MANASTSASDAGGAMGRAAPSSRAVSTNDDEKLALNLKWARQALDFKKEKLSFGASNAVPDLTFSDIIRSIAARGGVTVQKLAQIFGPEKTSDMENVASIADLALKFGSGNCGEQSAVVFCWLHENKVQNISLLSCKDADHMFVVIGVENLAWFEKLSEFPIFSVVCDPWSNRYYPARELQMGTKPMGTVFETVIHR